MITPCTDKHENYGIPTLEELGQDPELAIPEVFPGGEQEALKRLDKYMDKPVRAFYMQSVIKQSQSTVEGIK